jgi:hypothetical protein
MPPRKRSKLSLPKKPAVSCFSGIQLNLDEAGVCIPTRQGDSIVLGFSCELAATSRSVCNHCYSSVPAGEVKGIMWICPLHGDRYSYRYVYHLACLAAVDASHRHLLQLLGYAHPGDIEQLTASLTEEQAHELWQLFPEAVAEKRAACFSAVNSNLTVGPLATLVVDFVWSFVSGRNTPGLHVSFPCSNASLLKSAGPSPGSKGSREVSLNEIEMETKSSQSRRGLKNFKLDRWVCEVCHKQLARPTNQDAFAFKIAQHQATKACLKHAANAAAPS